MMQHLVHFSTENLCFAKEAGDARRGLVGDQDDFGDPKRCSLVMIFRGKNVPCHFHHFVSHSHSLSLSLCLYDTNDYCNIDIEVVVSIDFLFSPLPGEMIQLDECFSNGLVQPPTRYHRRIFRMR